MRLLIVAFYSWASAYNINSMSPKAGMCSEPVSKARVHFPRELMVDDPELVMYSGALGKLGRSHAL